MCKLGAEKTHFDADHGSLPVCRGDSGSSAGWTDDELVFLMNGTDSIVFRLQRVERDREEPSPLGHGGRGDECRPCQERGGMSRGDVRDEEKECGFWFAQRLVIYCATTRCSTGGTFPRLASACLFWMWDTRSSVASPNGSGAASRRGIDRHATDLKECSHGSGEKQG